MRNIDINKLNLPCAVKRLSYSECRSLCTQIRRILIKTVSQNGGHLASNLGTVELTMAIHRVFDLPEDKVVWDVGHQSYTHKILSGRLKDFSTLRKKGGLSGFPKPCESAYDPFICGHSSNSISAAAGIAAGMRISGSEHCAVAVIGDGAMTGGLSFEGLNNAGKSRDNLIVILNHNDMSISKNVGALAKYLSHIRSRDEYLNTKQFVEKALDGIPIIGGHLKQTAKDIKSILKTILYHSTMFEDLGFAYLGPVDGHNLPALEQTLRMAKRLKKPVVVHVNTVKGKGFAPAEKNPGAYHGVSQFDINNFNPEIISDDSYSATFGKELTALADNDSRICAITAAMKYGTGLQYFASLHKDRFFDVGIAEQHAITFASGLATDGFIPVAAIYSSFLQRAYDQILHDCAIANNHIVIAIDRAGIVGEDGETHQGVFDVPFLTTIPNVSIFSPSDYDELRLCLKSALYDTDGIACIRYPRGNENGCFANDDLNTGYSLISCGATTLAISYGRIFNDLYCASKECTVDLFKLTKIFPLNDEIYPILKKYKRIVFFEEGMESGSIAEHLSLELQKRRYRGKFEVYALNGFIPQDTVENTLNKFHLDKTEMIRIINGDK